MRNRILKSFVGAVNDDNDTPRRRRYMHGRKRHPSVYKTKDNPKLSFEEEE
tara:strand:+ start:320 stop:472 length:153 start_codon:yes stop_codon:yes gene_type:complete